MHIVIFIGALYDPDDVPGLANLVGHALMNRERKYEKPYRFSEFVRRHGGMLKYPNTNEEYQSFTFEINNVNLTEALRR